MTKEDVLNQLDTYYTYDVQYPLFYGSQGNRLMESQTRNASNEVVQERFYLYDAGGRANYVVVKDDPMAPGPAGPSYTGTQILYNTQGMAAVAWKTRWRLTADGSAVDQTTVEYLSAMQYRHDGGRSRYLVQRSDPREYLPSGSYNTHFRYPWTPGGNPEWSASEGKWADYAGGEIRGDFAVTVSGTSQNPTATTANTMAHEAGLAQAPWTGALPPSEADVAYLHGNLIGSVERMTGAQDPQTADPPPVVRRAVFTAFGEPVFEEGSVGTRYGYAGAWGYQGTSYTASGDPPMTGDPLEELGWLHVGARYYDRVAGRFMQRDPIGMAGGLNVYVYAGNNPVSSVDPLGLDWGDNVVYLLAGALDMLTIGISGCFFNVLGVEVDESSGWYTAGQVVGFVAPIAGGARLGFWAAAKGAGKEFSHWWPKRWGGPRRWWNGNYVSPRLHYKTDKWRNPPGWSAWGRKYPHGLRQLIRTPYPFSFGALGGLYSGASAATGGIGDD